ncbi:MAG: hypothetical protein COV55_01535 [Candidatus Komeilibacteria bacterium CG11_big_fil_rev_8_21_14_0_20_36_20]|uniref:Uncharacterized protein n=1 Tax=Candidatus Komeilibacteria bacterium CG11_big_fil_rev_8_21_14_0_20_36_20 TaxID=1974477 RepID=A0A2H0NDX2_9BACT|nr:MAG: hypothetical protein COV55_01535 [Candidatus Komeilibacteria bacterium CG11_big_fil_rev_8_21_14_0_20_36_20]PIR81224.1 MAG: hypothetical protein COU21_04520 [Candidatus Komeilibacteria bacterium CG10_big_fil_rev_8_21_14_0_10_36_65]PJC55188.1 MAG: hypothetical protein CO027_03460 [Candidatus Komeilibacteria bacterium CG_4_9_14_0_2_um_filter_36_13]
MWHHLSKKDQHKFLCKWIKKITYDETDLSIKRHVVRHAKHIYDRDPRQWAASMRNLVQIFEDMQNIKPSTTLQLDRLYNKYKSNKHRYTKPPKL